jgi:TRAP-type C4-dicarboxylate transport system permease small subunit
MARTDDPVTGDSEASQTAVFEAEPPLALDSLEDTSQPEVLPGREPWRRIIHGIGFLEQLIGAVLIVVILALVIGLIVQRYVPGVSLPWTGEVARLCMVWATFVVSGYLASRDRHIAIHVVDYVLSCRSLGVIKLLANVVVLATCLGLVLATVQLIESDVGQVTPAAQIPLRLVNLVPLFGFALTALRALLAIVVLDLPALAARQETAR